MSVIRTSRRLLRTFSTLPSRPLLDTFSRPHTYLRLSLTERCNLRCKYCMPDTTPDPVPPPTHLTRPEIHRLLSIFCNRGVDKLRLTGGEPTLRHDLPDIVQSLSALPLQIGITTNGLILSRLLPRLVDAGLSTVNVSLDSLVPARFELLTKRPGHHRVLKAIRDCVSAGVLTKVNVVVMKGVNEDELPNFVALTENEPVDVRFIEYMPFDGNRWSGNKFVPYATMLESVARHYGRLEKVPTARSDTTKYYRVPHFVGRLGFITSMTDHFCSGCNRIRVTADGNLKVCLFGNDEVSLRDVIRGGGTDHDVENVIEQALRGKHFALGGKKDMYDISRSENRSMVRIGG